MAPDYYHSINRLNLNRFFQDNPGNEEKIISNNETWNERMVINWKTLIPNFCPKNENRSEGLLALVGDTVKQSITSIKNNELQFNNIPLNQRNVLEYLLNAKNIALKSSDKVVSVGSVGSIAIKAFDKIGPVMNKTDNDKPCCDILKNKTFYKELKEDPSKELQKKSISYVVRN